MTIQPAVASTEPASPQRSPRPERERFSFGENWRNFLATVDDDKIAGATARLRKALGDLQGKTFLDVGCGSGLHSLAAVRLGARLVHSFDYDSNSVGCAVELKRRFAPDADWTMEQGSALDAVYLRS